MAIVDDFPAIKAAIERNKPAKSKHSLLLEAVICEVDPAKAERLPPEPVTSWKNASDYAIWKVSPDGTKWRWVAATPEAAEAWRQIHGSFGE